MNLRFLQNRGTSDSETGTTVQATSIRHSARKGGCEEFSGGGAHTCGEEALWYQTVSRYSTFESRHRAARWNALFWGDPLGVQSSLHSPTSTEIETCRLGHQSFGLQSVRQWSCWTPSCGTHPLTCAAPSTWPPSETTRHSEYSLQQSHAVMCTTQVQAVMQEVGRRRRTPTRLYKSVLAL